MISRSVQQCLNIAIKTLRARIPLVTSTQYNFSRQLTPKSNSNLVKIVEEQIKAQESSLTDVKISEEQFSKDGWKITKQNTLVELSKTVGKYTVRLLSNIKSPNNFNQEDQNQQQQKQQGQQQDFNGEMNQITILVTKNGQQKTMIVNTVVTDNFQISSILFHNSVQAAKKQRLDIFNTNNYTGPQVQTLSQDLFEGIHDFLQKELKINGDLLIKFGDYCLDSEQSFYIQWLRDLKSFL